tara:strand:+ start:1790 stop:2068 length:279 start_codon:yes stop_codon:yes gene_type:complete
MSNLQNEQCMEDTFEEIVEDNITKRDLVGVIEYIQHYLKKNIMSDMVDDFVKVDNMALLKTILREVRKIDDKARSKAEHFCEKNKDFWIKGD